MSRDGSETTSTDDPYERRRARMVERQLRRRGIEDERVLAAMEEVPRERFVPEDMRRDAYRDGALRIGEGQTISQPWIVACMASLLELEGDERVLEVGTGSGYAAAALDDPPAPLLEQLGPGAALVCPVERGGRELLMRFREGAEEAVVPVRFVPLIPDEENEEE